MNFFKSPLNGYFSARYSHNFAFFFFFAAHFPKIYMLCSVCYVHMYLVHECTAGIHCCVRQRCARDAISKWLSGAMWCPCYTGIGIKAKRCGNEFYIYCSTHAISNAFAFALAASWFFFFFCTLLILRLCAPRATSHKNENRIYMYIQKERYAAIKVESLKMHTLMAEMLRMNCAMRFRKNIKIKNHWYIQMSIAIILREMRRSFQEDTQQIVYGVG